MSSTKSAVDSIRPRSMTRPHAICRHAGQIIKEYIRTGQTLSYLPYNSIRDHVVQEGNDVNPKCFSYMRKLELSFINVSEIMLIMKFNLVLNKQDASTGLNILG